MFNLLSRTIPSLKFSLELITSVEVQILPSQQSEVSVEESEIYGDDLYQSSIGGDRSASFSGITFAPNSIIDGLLTLGCRCRSLLVLCM